MKGMAAKYGDQLAFNFLEDITPSLKDNIHTMEHPFFSLSTKKDLKIRRYEHNGVQIEIQPNVVGMPTMFDKDVLVFCISHIMAQIQKGIANPGKTVRFITRQFLTSTDRGYGGDKYKALEKALKRLKGVSITTSIRTNNSRVAKGFGLIEDYEVIEKSEIDKRMIAVQITLSDWVYNAIIGGEILTLHPDYYKIKSPLKKRIYELARKHCGAQAHFTISMEVLHKKSGASSVLKKFRYQISQLVSRQDLPDYYLIYDKKKDKVTFTPIAGTVKKLQNVAAITTVPQLKSDTIEKIRTMLHKKGRGYAYDVYALQEEWLYHWSKTGREKLDNPDGAFYNFCQNKPALK